VEEGPGGVVAVDLVEEASAVLLDNGFAGEEFFQEDATAGAVDAGKAGDRSAVGEDEVFGFAKDFPGFAVGLGGAFLGDFRTVGLGINRGARGEEQGAFREGVEQVAAAFEIHAPISIGAATTRRCAMKDKIGLKQMRFQFSHTHPITEITRQTAIAAGERYGKNLPTPGEKLARDRLPEVAVA